MFTGFKENKSENKNAHLSNCSIITPLNVQLRKETGP